LSFDCFLVDASNNEKAGYIYNRNLTLVGNSQFKKWFSFEVLDIKDLVGHYDEMMQALSGFPKNPELIDFEDRMGKREVIKYPNEEFNDKRVICDLFFILD